MSWIPTVCNCGRGVLLPREEPACSCEQVIRKKVRDDIVEVPTTGLTADQLADQSLMNFLALTQLRARRQRTGRQAPEPSDPAPAPTAGTKKAAAPERVTKTAPVKKMKVKKRDEHRRDYKAEHVAYIASSQWVAKRKEYIAAVNPTQCPVCKDPWGKGGHIHHKSYKHMGAEPLEDLVHLCEDCHEKIHILYKRPIWRRRGLRATTDHVLARGLRALPALPRGHTVETLALSDLA